MRTLNIHVYVDIVFKILLHFLKRETSRPFEYFYFDIELISGDKNLYYIRVTNYGKNGVCSRGLEFVFRQIMTICVAQLFNNEQLDLYFKTIEFIVKEEQDSDEHIYELKWIDKSYKVCPAVKVEQTMRFAHWKKYLSLRLECKIYAEDIEIFKNFMIEKLAKLNEGENNAKCVFRSDDEIFWRNEIHVERDTENLKSVIAAIMTLIRYTRNRDLRDRCLRLLCASKESEAEGSVTDKISLLIQNKYWNKGNGKLNNREPMRKRTRQH